MRSRGICLRFTGCSAWPFGCVENELSHRLVIIGGGVIGLKFASVFSAMGVKVTVVEMLPSLLANMDEEISKRLIPLLKRQGIEIMTKTVVESIRQEFILMAL